MVKKFLTLLIVSFFLLQNVEGQTLKYDVIKGSKNLGSMVVKREVSGAVEEIKFESDVTIKLLLSFHVDFNQYEKFVNGELNWGKALSKMNGRTQKDSKIVANQKGHLLTLDGVSAQVTDPIDFSVSQIYFYEPVDGQKVFSQQFAQFMTLKKVGPHRYLMSSPDGDNYYTYTNGICTHVRVQRDFANFNFVITPDSMAAVEAKADSLYVRAKTPD